MDLTTEALLHHQNVDQGMDRYRDRGITDTAIEHFKLGYIADPGHKYTGGLSIPYLTTTGKVICLKARLFNSKLKYVTVGQDYPLPVPKFHLFNAKAALPSPRRRQVFIVEGELDAVIGWQAGLKTVAVPGCTQWYDPWTWLFSHSEVTIAFDGDGPGEEGAAKLAGTFTKARVEHRIAVLPKGKDLTDLWLEGGRELVRSALGVE